MPIVLTGGQCGDSWQFIQVMAGVPVPCRDGGPPRTRPEQGPCRQGVRLEGHHEHLCGRGAKATIPIKADQAANRHKKAARDDRPPTIPSSTNNATW